MAAGAEEEDMAAAAIAFLQGNNDGEVAAEQQPAAVNNTMSASAAAASSHLGGLEDDSEEEEDECRVCRGPAEEDNPLYKPCKCSGSIGLTHQDCLRQWLNVQQRGSGDVCELCKTPFKFAPLYAANAPDRLSPLQVVIGVARRAVAQWFPFVVRCCLAASLWLIVAPLLTNYLYQAWMHRPSLIWERLWSWKLLTTDLVSGAVVAACVIVSFLSLMSFADFLRVELQQRGGIGNNNNHANANNNNGRNANAANANEGADDAQNNNNNNNNNNNAAAAPAVGEGQNRLQRQGPDEPLLQPADAEIDNELFMRAQFGGGSSSELADLDGSSDSSNNNIINEDDSDKNNLKTQQQSEKAKTENSGASEALPAAVVAENNNRNDVNDNNNNNEGNNDDPWLPLHRPGDRDEAVAHQRNNLDGGDDNDDDDEDFIPPAHEDDDENMIEDDLDHDEARELQEEAMRLLRAAAGGDGQQNRNQQQQQRPNNPNNNNNDAGRNNNNNNFLDLDPDDAMEMDINIALDELLGVRGPLRVVVRNLVWLLAFNAVYLGFFTFFPRLVGTALLSAIFGQTLSPTDEPPTIHSLMAPFSTVTSMSSGFKFNNASLYNMSALELEELYNKTFPLRDRIAHTSAANASAATAHDFCGNASYCVWFLPRFVKSTLHYLITNETVVFDDETNSTIDEFPVLNLTSSSSLYEIASAVEVESHRLNTTFRLSDLINVTVGYLVFAVSVIFMRSLWTLSKKIHFLRSNRGRTDNNNNLAGIAAEVGVDLDEDFRIVFDEVNRRLGANNNNNNINLNDWADEQAVPLTFTIGLALDALTAVVKVGILLLLKMFLLPIGLGICLDISILSQTKVCFSNLRGSSTMTTSTILLVLCFVALSSDMCRKRLFKKAVKKYALERTQGLTDDDLVSAFNDADIEDSFSFDATKRMSQKQRQQQPSRGGRSGPGSRNDYSRSGPSSRNDYSRSGPSSRNDYSRSGPGNQRQQQRGGGRQQQGRGSPKYDDEDDPTFDRKTNMRALEAAGFIHLYGLAPVLNALVYNRRNFDRPEDRIDLNSLDGEAYEHEKRQRERKPEAQYSTWLFVQDTYAPSSSGGSSNSGVRSSRSREKNIQQQRVLEWAERRGVPVAYVDKGVLNTLSGNRPHQGFVLRCGPLEWPVLSSRISYPADTTTSAENSITSDGNDEEDSASTSPMLWLILDEVVDPQNLGALLRSAHFLGEGMVGVLVCAKNSAPPSATVSAASAGALECIRNVFETPHLVKTLQWAEQDGFEIIGASSSSLSVSMSTKSDERVEQERVEREIPLYDLHDLPADLQRKPTMLILGSEGRGLRHLVARCCTAFVRIPPGIAGSMTSSSSTAESDDDIEKKDGEDDVAGVDSLNVSVTGGILLWHFLNQLR